MPMWCHMFNSTLIGTARVWFDELTPESIDGYKAFKAAFLAYFMQQKKYVKDLVEIYNIKQRDGETIEDFMERFKVETGRMRGAPECMRISGFMHGVNNAELTKHLNEQKGHTPWKPDRSNRHGSERKSNFPGQSKEGRGCSRFTPFTRTPKEILAAKAGKFKPPPPMVTPAEKRSSNKFFDFHNDKGHNMDECMQLKKQIEELVLAGKLSHLVKEIKQNKEQPKAGKKDAPAKDNEITFPPLATSGGAEGPLVIEAKSGGYMIHCMYVDGGSSTEALGYNRRCRSFHKSMDEFHDRKVIITYNGIIRRPRIREIQAVPATAYGMLKFLIDGGIVTIRSTILIPAECATVITSSKETPKEDEVRQENFKVALHLNFSDQEVIIGGTLSAKERTELCSLLKRNLDIFAWQPSDMTRVPRSMAESDEEKTAFHTSQGVYFYTKMPFGLKNACATYQRLVDKAFDNQVGQNIEVYVDELVIKSHIEAEMLRDIDETFCALRKINMKLNPKKCTFGVVEGMFLRYMISPEGIKLYHDKTKVVLQLSSPRTIKEVQSLNVKLASLNIFLSKSAEKSLPLFKTLKKCINKSDFHWTPEAEQAFKQLKQHLSDLPLLVAPKPKEELIVYLSASHRAISAVLMTERGTVQTLVYFISCALQGLELNYTLMEKASSIIGEHSITYRPRTTVKGQILADFLIEKPDESPPETPVVEIPQEPWTLFTDGSSCVDGSGAGLTLTSPEGTEFTYVLRFQFTASNNEAEYEALIAGLRIAAQMGVRNVYVSIDSKLVANQVLGTYVAKEENMIKFLKKVKSLVNGFVNLSISQVPRSKNKKADALSKIASTSFANLSKQVLEEILKNKSIQKEKVVTIVEEEGPTWMTPIMEYLKNGTLPDDRKQASKLRIKARQYELLEEVLYRRSFLKPWLRCVGPLQANYMIREIHEGSCREIVSDNGKQFSDNPFKDWCKKLNITQRFASVKHPQSNGLIERANRSLGEGIKARLGEGNKNWMEELPHVLWAHRTMIKSSHGDTLFSLTYGTKAVIPLEIRMPTYRTAIVDAVHNNEELQLNLDLLEERRECAAIREAKAKLKMTKYYNARVRGVTFRPRDFVYHSNDASHAADGGKLGQKWEGPYEITEALGDGAYKLKSVDGTVLPRTWNIANLKKCYL
ncbi:reverse transcriptase domain-containing protein [Tanacetum coccineum]